MSHYARPGLLTWALSLHFESDTEEEEEEEEERRGGEEHVGKRKIEEQRLDVVPWTLI